MKEAAIKSRWPIYLKPKINIMFINYASLAPLSKYGF